MELEEQKYNETQWENDEEYQQQLIKAVKSLEGP